MSKTPNTYRVYFLTAAAASLMEPTASVGFVRESKYGEAWRGARAALRGDAEKAIPVFADADCTVPLELDGPNTVVARIDDCRPRNVKLDKTALLAIANDASKPESERLAALSAALG